jgi:hypothetical protein
MEQAIIFGLVIFLVLLIFIYILIKNKKSKNNTSAEDSIDSDNKSESLNENIQTVRDVLKEKCPKQSDAGDKINKDNAATYEDYLFSACKAANTCDKKISEADDISKALIYNVKNCGNWDIPNTLYSWNYNNKWVKNKTVRDALIKKCPKQSDAGDKINKDNVATYEDYLFGACLDANTCDKKVSEADKVSKAIIDNVKNCGNWGIPNTNYTWNSNNKRFQTPEESKKHDYITGEYKDSVGCADSSGTNYCWNYCGLNWKAGDWQWSKNRNNDWMKCNDKKHCQDQWKEQGFYSFEDLPQGGICAGTKGGVN